MTKEVYLIGHREVEFEPTKIYSPQRPHIHPPDFYKIGIATEPEKRVSELETGTPHKLELITTIRSNDARMAEQLLHSIYSLGRKGGEWFFLSTNAVNSLKAIDFVRTANLEVVRGQFKPYSPKGRDNLYISLMNVRKYE